MAAPDLLRTIKRVEHDLKWSIWPYGDEVRPHKGLEGADLESFGIALGHLKDARYALDPFMSGGEDSDRGIADVGEALDVLDHIPPSRIPPEVNTERATALRDLGIRIGRE